MPKGQFPRKKRPARSFAAWLRAATPGEAWWSEREPAPYAAEAKRAGYQIDTAVFYATHATGHFAAEVVPLTRVRLIGPLAAPEPTLPTTQEY